MKKLVLLTCVLVTITVLAPLPAIACSCVGPRPPCSHMDHDVVFIGRVLDGRRDTVHGFQRMVHTLAVERVVKGIADSGHVVVETGIGGGDCGIYFATDTSYLVYGMRHGDRITTGMCSRTGRVGRREADLRYFDSISSHKEWSVIYGRVSATGRLYGPGIDGAKIVVSGEDGSREVIADPYGFFEVDGLPDGRYSVRWLAPAGLTSYPSEISVTVTGHDCSEVSFAFEKPDRE